MIKIKQQIVVEKLTYIFTENPEQDIKEIQKMYNNKDRSNYMGYELPELVDYEFLGNKYKAISFWHDNEDVRDIVFTTPPQQ
jgi:hypothetical protein